MAKLTLHYFLWEDDELETYVSPFFESLAVAKWHVNHVVTSEYVQWKEFNITGDNIICEDTFNKYGYFVYLVLRRRTDNAKAFAKKFFRKNIPEFTVEILSKERYTIRVDGKPVYVRKSNRETSEQNRSELYDLLNSVYKK